VQIAAAGIATALGFFFTFLTFSRRVRRKTEQLKLAEKIHETIIKLDQELEGIKEMMMKMHYRYGMPDALIRGNGILILLIKNK
jgi:hypothetical protein